jgi:hypothetical protein
MAYTGIVGLPKPGDTGGEVRVFERDTVSPINGLAWAGTQTRLRSDATDRNWLEPADYGRAAGSSALFQPMRPRLLGQASGCCRCQHGVAPFFSYRDTHIGMQHHVNRSFN